MGPTGPQTTALVLHSRGELVLCDVSAAAADALTVDVLATLELLTRRRRGRIRLRHASPELLELIAFMGLEEVLEPCGEAEEREQPLGVKEERQLDDMAF